MTAKWLIKRPANPSKWDDEFEGARIHPKWSRYVTADPAMEEHTINAIDGSASQQWQNIHRFKRSWIYRQPAGQGVIDNGQGYTQDCPDLPEECFIYMRGGRSNRRGTAADGDCEIALRLLMQNNDYALIMWDSASSIVSPLHARSVASAGGYANIGLVRNFLSIAESVEYLGLQRLGFTYHAWAASSSGNWLWINSYTHVSTPSYFLFAMGNTQTATPGTATQGVDFFRVIPGSKLP